MVALTQLLGNLPFRVELWFLIDLQIAYARSSPTLTFREMSRVSGRPSFIPTNDSRVIPAESGVGQ